MTVVLLLIVLVLLVAGGAFYFIRRRRESITELPLPPDYAPIDYTSLPQEEPRRGPSPQVRLMIIVGALLIVGALGGLYVLMAGEDDSSATQAPTYTIDLRRADLVNVAGELQIDVSARTKLPAGTIVQAQLLAGEQPFEFWRTGAPTTTVEGATLEWPIPVGNDFRPGTRDVTYTLQLVAEVDGTSVSGARPLEFVSDRAKTAFYEGLQPTKTPAPSATPAPATPSPTLIPLPPIGGQPSPTPAAAGGPLTALAQQASVIYLSPFGPTGQRGSLRVNDRVRVVAKLWTGDWYLVVAPATTGWVQGSALNLGGASVPVAGGSGNQAAVFNGGNVRNAPVSGAVVGTINAGETVQLLARNSDSSWFRVQAPGGTGWVSAALLTIDPKVVAGVPVQ